MWPALARDPRGTLRAEVCLRWPRGGLQPSPPPWGEGWAPLDALGRGGGQFSGGLCGGWLSMACLAVSQSRGRAKTQGPFCGIWGTKAVPTMGSGVPGRPGERLCAELSVGLTHAGASPRPSVESPRLLERGLPGAPTRQPGDEGPRTRAGWSVPHACWLPCL